LDRRWQGQSSFFTGTRIKEEEMEKPEPLNMLWITAGVILVFASVLIPVFKTQAPTPTKIFIKANDNEDVISHFQITRSTTISLIKDKKTGDCFIISDSKDASTRLKVECD
jgi:hypothetical protein